MSNVSRNGDAEQKPIVVIGSAHLDIYAEARNYLETVDRPGVLTVQVGGTAFNLAVNLSELGCPVTLMSALNDTLPLSGMITETLRERGIKFEYESNPKLGQSGFSSHLVDGDMVSAVAAVTLEEHEFAGELLDRQIASARFVVAECNLSSSALELIGRLCVLHSVPLAVALVSEGKALRLAESGVSARWVFGNEREFRYIEENRPDRYQNLLQRSVCFMTRGSDGVDLIQLSRRQHWPSPSVPFSKRHFAGAGDAFTAGVLHYLYHYPGNYSGAIVEAQALSCQVIGRNNANLGKEDLVNSHLSKLKHLVERDPLTGLCNRRAGEAWFHNCISDRRIAQITILVIDIDHFKRVNDDFGHGIGDLVIRAVSNVIQDQVRFDESLTARWGGEEFLIGLRASAVEGQQVARRICEACREITISDAPELDRRISVSIGVAVWERAAATEYEGAIEEADSALYRAKNGGRNRVEVAA